MIKDPVQKGPTSKKLDKDKKVVKPKEELTIPDDKLKEFVWHVKNLFQIDANKLWENRFRINVWTETYSEENNVVPAYNIVKSFFVHYHNGIIIDKTIQPKPKEEKIF